MIALYKKQTLKFEIQNSPEMSYFDTDNYSNL
jgi:hypothetical protein